MGGSAASKHFGEKWAALPQEEKDALNAQYRTEFEEYKKKMAEYKKTDEYKKFQKASYAKKFKKCPKDKNAPKKPLSAYFMFLADNRESMKAEFPELKITELGKKVGELWKALSEEEKEVYKAKSRKAEEEFKAVRAAYEQTEAYAEYSKKKAAWEANKKRAKRSL